MIPGRAFRWGQLIAGIESARAAIELARRSWDLLDEDDRKAIAVAADLLAGLEQRAWARKPTKSKP